MEASPQYCPIHSKEPCGTLIFGIAYRDSDHLQASDPFLLPAFWVSRVPEALVYTPHNVVCVAICGCNMALDMEGTVQSVTNPNFYGVIFPVPPENAEMCNLEY